MMTENDLYALLTCGFIAGFCAAVVLYHVAEIFHLRRARRRNRKEWLND